MVGKSNTAYGEVNAIRAALDKLARTADPAAPAEPWLRGEGIQGIGLGRKIKGNVVLERHAMRVYVDRKLPLETLRHPVPPEIAIRGDVPVVTDVVEIGELKAQSFALRMRPLRPGYGVGHVNVGGGTIAAIVRPRSGAAKKYILSNAHVLTDSGLLHAGDIIVQPAVGDGGVTASDRIGLLVASVPFDYAQNGFPNTVDAAIAEIDAGLLPVDPRLPVLDLPPMRILKGLRRGMRVQKVGRSTGHTWGEIVDIDFRGFMKFADPHNPGREVGVGFHDQILCSRFTEKGDSGSLVLSSSGRVVGLHFAGSARASVFNRIANVLDALDIELDIG